MTETQFEMVSEWMDNGNTNQLLVAHRDVNRFELVPSRSCPTFLARSWWLRDPRSWETSRGA